MPAIVNGITITRDGNPGIEAALDQYHAGSAGGTATVTLAAEAGRSWVIRGFILSSSAALTAGAVGIAATGMTSRSYKVTSEGLGVVKLPANLICPVGQAVAVTFATGGGSGVPTLEVLAWKE